MTWKRARSLRRGVTTTKRMRGGLTRAERLTRHAWMRTQWRSGNAPPRPMSKGTHPVQTLIEALNLPGDVTSSRPTLSREIRRRSRDASQLNDSPERLSVALTRSSPDASPAAKLHGGARPERVHIRASSSGPCIFPARSTAEPPARSAPPGVGVFEASQRRAARLM